MKDQLIIKNMFASADGKPILRGVTLAVKKEEVHAIMGPNGSGKSTLAHVLMGNPSYELRNTNYELRIGKTDLSSMSTEERAKAGLFLAFQTPVTLPGVSVFNLLRSAYMEIHSKTPVKRMHNPGLASVNFTEFTKSMKVHAKFIHIDESFLKRGIGDGFSGGEKKKMEMLQALVLSPKFAIFDEIDTGLDVDALKTVAIGISLLKKKGVGVIIITHYQRILKYLKPDIVHVLVHGKIVDTGTSRLAQKIEKEGYKKYDRKSH